MKAQLQFDLDNPDDVISHKRCIKDLEEIMDEMLEFDSKIGTVIDCGACSNKGCKVCK